MEEEGIYARPKEGGRRNKEQSTKNKEPETRNKKEGTRNKNSKQRTGKGTGKRYEKIRNNKQGIQRFQII